MMGAMHSGLTSKLVYRVKVYDVMATIFPSTRLRKSVFVIRRLITILFHALYNHIINGSIK